jgi:hypothetical protein
MRAVGVVRSVGTGVSCNPTVSSTAFTLRLSPNFDHHIRLDRPQAQPGRHAPPMRRHPLREGLLLVLSLLYMALGRGSGNWGPPGAQQRKGLLEECGDSTRRGAVAGARNRWLKRRLSLALSLQVHP